MLARVSQAGEQDLSSDHRAFVGLTACLWPCTQIAATAEETPEAAQAFLSSGPRAANADPVKVGRRSETCRTCMLRWSPAAADSTACAGAALLLAAETAAVTTAPLWPNASGLTWPCLPALCPQPLTPAEEQLWKEYSLSFARRAANQHS
jgi:hypothetical protein